LVDLKFVGHGWIEVHIGEFFKTYSYLSNFLKDYLRALAIIDDRYAGALTCYKSVFSAETEGESGEMEIYFSRPCGELYIEVHDEGGGIVFQSEKQNYEKFVKDTLEAVDRIKDKYTSEFDQDFPTDLYDLLVKGSLIS
jgi:hypothetical protein